MRLKINTIARLSKDDNDISTVSFSTLHNAGIALLGNRLPQLFSDLSYLDSNKAKFKSKDEKIKAMLALEYLVGYDCDTFHEHQLLLNMLLVGYNESTSLPSEIDLSKSETDTIDLFLERLLNEWECMKRRNVANLQKLYLQRTGFLEKKQDEWHLCITQESEDMMINSLPWNYDKIQLPWMDTRIDVKWIYDYDCW